MSWWRRGVVYEAYPRSFLDTDGDGVGDLHGITAQLPYLRWLGVDAVWLTPIYPSPQRDFGYDITDHTAIDPQFGTLEDFDALVAAAHRHGLRVILDYVPNHTSNRHPWFRERPDWYLWHDGPPPNNWVSVFGGSAWEQVGERSGFTDGEPWLPYGDLAINVAAQRDDPRSMLALHRRLLALRGGGLRDPAGRRRRARIPARRADGRRAQPDRRAPPAAGGRRGGAEHALRRQRRLDAAGRRRCPS
jgi:glycosidase